jgi:proline dehydrogenase
MRMVLLFRSGVGIAEGPAAAAEIGRLAAMAEHGHPTREYVVFGTEWWLYVCNRLAEDPQRLLQAVIDAAS